MIGRRSYNWRLVIGSAELQDSMWESLVPVVRIWSLWFILRSLMAFSLQSLSGCIFMNKVKFSELGKRLVKLTTSGFFFLKFGMFYCLLLRLVQLSQWEVLFKNNLKIDLMALAKTLMSVVKHGILWSAAFLSPGWTKPEIGGWVRLQALFLRNFLKPKISTYMKSR